MSLPPPVGAALRIEEPRDVLPLPTQRPLKVWELPFPSPELKRVMHPSPVLTADGNHLVEELVKNDVLEVKERHLEAVQEAIDHHCVGKAIGHRNPLSHERRSDALRPANADSRTSGEEFCTNGISHVFQVIDTPSRR